jgi:glycosyltransferase involved in cell wall biosynthesis
VTTSEAAVSNALPAIRRSPRSGERRLRSPDGSGSGIVSATGVPKIPTAVALPTITIVTPCLDASVTLPGALDSVRSQEQGYPAAVEHIVVDGGSTDGTLEILGAAEGVSFISEPDRGLSDAVNKGFRRAQGEIVGWLNADDVYLPGAFARIGEAFAAEPEALWATGRCTIIDGDGRQIRRAVSAYKDFFLRRYSFPLLLVQNFVCCPSTFVRRRAMDEVGLLDERFRYSMDYDLWLRLGRRAPPVVVDHPIAAFRMAEGSLSMTGFEAQFREHALNAREHGEGHRLAVAANAALSRAIVGIYHGLRLLRPSRT